MLRQAHFPLKKKRLHIAKYFSLLVLLSLLGCNSKGYQNLNARYNGYFYSDLYLNEVYQEFENRYEYNFDEFLKVFPEVDSSVVQGNKEKLDDAFKKSSQIIEWWEASDWVDDSYYIIGKIRYLRSQWQYAIETFQYINQNSKDDAARQKALIALMRTYMDRGSIDQAEKTLGFIELEELTEENRKDFFLTAAYFYQTQEDFEKVEDYLSRVQPILEDKIYKIRVNFILGQLAQENGEFRDAFFYYDNALKGNPPYEILFHAKLNKLAVSGLANPNNVNTTYEVFEKMLKDGKNLEYQDIIYYTVGILEQNRNELQAAIDNYKKATQVEQPNTRQQGLAFLRLGEIYYEDLENFNLASAYYDSAVNKLPQDLENYEAIEKRQVVLKDFVTQLNIIDEKDSLLALTELSEVQLEAFVSRYLADEEAKQKAKEREREGRNNSGINRVDDSAFESSDGNSSWYFYNQQAVAQGQLEFQRIWGNRPLENDWRRSLKQSTSTEEEVAEAEPDMDDPNLGAAQPDLQSSREEKIEELMASFPRTEAEKEEANLAIQDAYFKLGSIYRFGLEQEGESISSYQTLLSRYPDTKHRLDALYALYTLFETRDIAKANEYKQMIIDEFPENLLAKTLVNPNYLQEKAERNRALQEIYAEAFTAYESGNYMIADQKLRAALASFEDVDFLPTVELLAAMLKAKTESIISYEQALNDFIEKYPEEPQANFAKNLIAAIEPAKEERLGNLKEEFSEDFQQIHLVAFTFSEDEFNSDSLQESIDAFNKENFKLKLFSGYVNFNPIGKIGVVFINSFPVKSAAENYRKALQEWFKSEGLSKDSNFHNFAISQDNFTQLFQNKALEEYLDFHEKFYE